MTKPKYCWHVYQKAFCPSISNLQWLVLNLWHKHTTILLFTIFIFWVLLNKSVREPNTFVHVLFFSLGGFLELEGAFFTLTSSKEVFTFCLKCCPKAYSLNLLSLLVFCLSLPTAVNFYSLDVGLTVLYAFFHQI